MAAERAAAVEPSEEWTLRHVPDPRLGPVLVAARGRAGLGLRAAARRIGISPTYLLNLERGARSPSLVVAGELAWALALTGAECEVLAASAVPDRGLSDPRRRLAITPRPDPDGPSEPG